MATFSYYLKKDQPRDGLYPIWICLSDHGRRKRIPTGFYAAESEFDQKAGHYISQGKKRFSVFKIDGGTWDNKSANDELDRLKAKGKALIYGYSSTHTDWSLEMWASDMKEESSADQTIFVDFANNVIKEERNGNHIQNATVMYETVEYLRKFDKNLDSLYLVDINRNYIERFAAWATKGDKSRGRKAVSPNTISIRLRSVRTILNRAIERGVIDGNSYPFTTDHRKGFDIPELHQTNANKYISLKDLTTLNKATIDNHRLDSIRHLFLTSFHLRGMNWIDMAQLTKDNIRSLRNGDRKYQAISYIRQKTARKLKRVSPIIIEITPAIQAELDWFKNNTVLYDNYLLPIISNDLEVSEKDFKYIKETGLPGKRKFQDKIIQAIRNGELSLEALNGMILNDYIKQKRKRFNHGLRDLASSLGIDSENLSIYSARHSFAMAMRSKGESTEKIGQALAHSSLKTTQNYLDSFSVDEMTEATSIELD